jgi:hypothetical protein
VVVSSSSSSSSSMAEDEKSRSKAPLPPPPPRMHLQEASSSSTTSPSGSSVEGYSGDYYSSEGSTSSSTSNNNNNNNNNDSQTQSNRKQKCPLFSRTTRGSNGCDHHDPDGRNMRQRESHAESARNGAVATSGIASGTTTTTTTAAASSTTVANNAHHARAAQHYRCRIDLALVQAVSANVVTTESWPCTATGSTLVTTTPVEAYHGLMEVSTLVSPLMVFILLIHLYCVSVACAPWAFFLVPVLY